MSYSKIVGTGGYLPEKILTNADLEKLVETSDEWIMTRVGIRERHIAGEKETTSMMAAEAAKKAIEAAGLTVDDIDMIVVGTATPDQQFPSVACLMQNRLGMTRAIPAFDLNAACAGFVYALNIADNFIKAGQVKNVLAIGADALSRIVDWTDRGTCVLFGDGAGAVVLQQSDEPGVISTSLHAAGQYSSLLWADNHLWCDEPVDTIQMKGNEVFKIAVTKLGTMIEDALEGTGLSKQDIDWLIPHQANYRIIQAAAKKLQLPMEKVVLTVEKHGNTSAASIPLALDHAVRSGQIQPGENLFLEAFGAGLAWGSALVRY